MDTGRRQNHDVGNVVVEIMVCRRNATSSAPRSTAPGAPESTTRKQLQATPGVGAAWSRRACVQARRRSKSSAGLAVCGVRVAAGAVLLQLKTVVTCGKIADEICPPEPCPGAALGPPPITSGVTRPPSPEAARSTSSRIASAVGKRCAGSLRSARATSASTAGLIARLMLDGAGGWDVEDSLLVDPDHVRALRAYRV